MIVVSVTVGAAAAALIFSSGGTLLAGSLMALKESLPGTQLDTAAIGLELGQEGLTRPALALALMIESQVFVLAITVALPTMRNGYPDPKSGFVNGGITG